MLPFRTILHPTDFSEPAKWAFNLACALAQESDARLVVLHVAPPPFYDMAVLQQDEYQRIWQMLHRLQPANDTTLIEYRLRYGNRLRHILDVAKETRCNLIVMGSHPRSRLRRFLNHGFAEKLVLQAPCPAIAVRSPEAGMNSRIFSVVPDF
jgi:nucleotide-binding universal stress UspA family protein